MLLAAIFDPVGVSLQRGQKICWGVVASGFSSSAEASGIQVEFQYKIRVGYDQGLELSYSAHTGWALSYALGWQGLGIILQNLGIAA